MKFTIQNQKQALKTEIKIKVEIKDAENQGKRD